MHFNKFFTLSAMTTLAAATPVVKRTGGGGGGEGGGEGNCSSGLQCCEQTTTASDPAATAIFAVLGIDIGDVNALVGLNCSPITVIGSNSACSTSTVFCEDNSHGGLISIGCVPVTI